MFSIFLIVDGSPEALSASQFSIALSKERDCRVKACALVDSHEVLRATGFVGPGLCGSGVFIEAYERITQAMLDVADTLLESLNARAEGVGVEIEKSVLVGDPVELVNTGSSRDTLVIVGGNERNSELAKRIAHTTGLAVITIEPGGSSGMLVTDFGPLSEEMRDAIFTVSEGASASLVIDAISEDESDLLKKLSAVTLDDTFAVHNVWVAEKS